MSEIKTPSIIDRCPYCNELYRLQIDIKLKQGGLTTYLTRVHPNCPEFLMYIDTHYRLRGVQTIDIMPAEALGQGKKQPAAPSWNIDAFMRFFENDINTSRFYHIQKILPNKTYTPDTGLRAAKEVRYHALMRSDFYKTILRYFAENKLEFTFYYLEKENLVIVILNMYDTIMFTVGFDLSDFQPNLNIDTIHDAFNYVKQRAATLGELVLSIEKIS